MKPLKTFILEELIEHNIKDLTVKYQVGENDYLIVECPSSAQENDIVQYIDDVLLKEFPSSPENGERFFGDNMKLLNDAYFEYDKFEHIDNEHSDDYYIDIKFDERTFGRKVAKDDSLDIFKLTNIKYVLSFDEFNIQGETDDIDEYLQQIFVATESNNDNEYPVELKLLEKDIDYRT